MLMALLQCEVYLASTIVPIIQEEDKRLVMLICTFEHIG